LISPTSSGERRKEVELWKIANDFLAFALNQGVDTIADLKKIRKSEVKKLKKVRLVGTYHDGAVHLIE
jgi:hypothetical protein